MRKATGKVVSLVLALALVITSFSATFASAATKSETGSVTVENDYTLYLANLSGESDKSAAKTNDRDSFDLSEYIAATKITTEDHIEITSPIEITSVSVSGDSVISVSKDASTKEYTAKLRSDDAKGTAYVNVLYTATGERGDDEITVRATHKFTIVVLDSSTPILSSDSTVNKGKEVGGLASLNKNPGLDANKEYTKAGTDNDAYTSETAKVYEVASESTGASFAANGKGSAVATYTAVPVVDASDEANIDSETGRIKVSSSGTQPKYAVTYSGSKSDASVDSSDNTTITYGITDPVVGNTVRVMISSLENATLSTDSASGNIYYNIKKKVVEGTVKVENTVEGEIKEVKMGTGNKELVGLVDSATDTTITSKSKVYALISTKYDGTNIADIWWDVTGANLIDTTTGTPDLSIADGRLASVESKNGSVTLSDVTVSGKVTAKTTADITGGSANEVAGTTINIRDGAVVAKIDSGSATVNVYNGKVTGSLNAGAVFLDPDSEDATVAVASVKANTLTVDGTVAPATVSSFTSKDNNSASSTLIISGSKASIGAIDDDFWGNIYEFQNYVGTIPAFVDGDFTGYEQTGARLLVNDVDSALDATKATVNGALNIRYIELNGGAVTFASSVQVNEVSGGEADFIINAGALRITEAIATANTLKIANAADVKAGTVVYYTTSDIGDIDSFVTFGFDLKLNTSGNYDVYSIDGVEFAGLTLDATSVELVKGEKAVVTASAYPNGTNLPEGAVIAFYFNGDDSYVKGYKINDTQAELVAVEYNSEFSVLNEGTLTAQVEDEYGIQLEEYGEATCKVKVVEKKAPTETYKSDTTGDVVVASGNTYQFKITSLNGQTPSVVLGSDGVFELVGTSVEGSDYFFKFQAVGAAGSATGVYVNGDAKVATLYVDSNTGYTCDTTTVNVPAGGTYQVKITAASMPTLLPGNSIYTVAFASQEGNDYFFKITATSAQAGDVVGFYINGGARAFVATTV